MIYKLTFKKRAKKEWDKLDPNIRSLLKKKLEERLKKPHIKSAELSTMENCYKIKLRNSGLKFCFNECWQAELPGELQGLHRLY